MSPAGIQKLIDAGAEAGREFVEDFDEQRLLGHRVRRYLVLGRRLQENLDELGPVFEQLEPGLGAAPTRPPGLQAAVRAAQPQSDAPPARRRGQVAAAARGRRSAVSGHADRPQGVAAATFPQRRRR